MVPRIRARDLETLIGRTFLPSRWLRITQERVQSFADATGDHQYLHVDPERARRGRFGGPSAHGFLSLALTSALHPEDWPAIEGVETTINYGLDRVRFLRAVPVGARVRVLTRVVAVREKRPGEFLLRTEKTMEIEGEATPAFVAEQLSLLVAGGDRG
jgi:acyl dehydratase